MVTNPSCHLQIFGLCIKEQAWDQGVSKKLEKKIEKTDL
jgi:hypothetical protein